jgi:hypothetical protein
MNNLSQVIEIEAREPGAFFLYLPAAENPVDKITVKALSYADVSREYV